VTLPTFIPRLDPDDRPKSTKAVKHSLCSACGKLDIVDEASGCCRRCWRIVTLMPAVLEGQRRE